MKTSLLVGSLAVAFSVQTAVAMELQKESQQKERGAAKDSKRKQQRSRSQRDPTQLIKRFDKNGDGLLDESEVPASVKSRFSQLDRNKDGKLSQSELVRSSGRGGRRPGEVITGPARNERHADRLKVGDAAPDFTLADPIGKSKVTLSSFQGKKPVVLIFGSYT